MKNKRFLNEGAIGRHLLGVAIAIGVLPNAHAQYSATAYIPNGTVIGSTTTPGDISYSGGTPNSTGVVTFTSSPVASVRAAVTAFNPLGEALMSAGGIMTYRFEVVAQPSTFVPVDFSGLYSSFQTSRRQSATSFTLQTVNSPNSTYAYFESALQGCGTPGCLQFTTFNNTTYTSFQSDIQHVQGTFAGSLNMLTRADGHVVGEVQLFAGSAVDIGFVPGSGNAFIDPRLEIDAAYLLINPTATLTITQGVGNSITSVTAVPEPETYALMLAGFGVLGWMGRKQRRA